MTRYDSIDLLRGTAILGMILCHFVLFTTPDIGPYPAIEYFAGNVLGYWPAPLFTLLAGMSLGISLDKQRASGRTFFQIGRRTLVRAFVVFTIGVFFPIPVWGFYRAFYWDILPMIGFSIAFVFLVHRLKPKQLLLLALLVVALGFILSQAWHVSDYWRLGRYKASLTIGHLIMGFIAAGYFPVLPWVAFPLTGYAVGRHFFSSSSSTSARKAPLIAGMVVATTGSLANFMSYFGKIHDPTWKALLAFSFYPLSPSFFLFLAGILVIIFTLTHSAFDSGKLKAPSLNILRVFSRYSLTLYLLHFALLIGTQRFAGWLLRRDTDAFLRNSLNPLTAITLGIIAVPLLYKLCSWWDTHAGRYSFEWWLSKLIV